MSDRTPPPESNNAPDADPAARQKRRLPARVREPLQAFLGTEAASGILLLCAALIALVWANSPWHSSYGSLWQNELGLDLGGVGLRLDLHHWINDGLMALFFLVVGLEIKRELLTGELRDRRAAALPAIAALGGMVVPAALFLAVNAGTPEGHGWGIPMATDIAFALGVLTIAARHAPSGLKSFLLTLAIVDDIGAIIVIAVFYSSGIAALPLAIAVGIVALIVVLQRLGLRAAPVYWVLGIGLWLAVHASGVHATIAGVALGLLTPAEASPGEDVSPLETVESRLHPWTSFLIVPLFALANAGVHLTGDSLSEALRSPVTIGVVLGLVVGKILGISGASWLAVRARVGRLPQAVTWREVVGTSAVAGVGFTVALFVAELAYPSGAAGDQARVGVLLASFLAGGTGFAILRGSRT